jgi:hypothetical protein
MHAVSQHTSSRRPEHCPARYVDYARLFELEYFGEGVGSARTGGKNPSELSNNTKTKTTQPPVPRSRSTNIRILSPPRVQS